MAAGLDIELPTISFTLPNIEGVADGTEEDNEEAGAKHADGGVYGETEATALFVSPPKKAKIPAGFVSYDNARAFARSLQTMERGARVDAFVAGNFVYGDFVAQFILTQRIRARRLIISTLSLSERNVDMLQSILAHGAAESLDLVVSYYFYAHEKQGVFPYIAQRLYSPRWRFRLAVARIHSKTVQIEADDGRFFVMHGSANLRSSMTMEQVTVEENAALYGFFADKYDGIIHKYALVRRPLTAAETFLGERKDFDD